MEENVDLSQRDERFGDEPFVVCHWDTFDNETFKHGGYDTLEEAIQWAKNHYGDRIRESGADKVEIVNLKGKVVWERNVG